MDKPRCTFYRKGFLAGVCDFYEGHRIHHDPTHPYFHKFQLGPVEDKNEIDIESLGEIKKVNVGDVVEIEGYLFRCTGLYIMHNEVPAAHLDSLVLEFKKTVIDQGDSNGNVEDDL